MTIIDFMRKKLSEYPRIAEFLAGDDIHMDFTDPEPTNYGLSSNGDRLIKEDLLGNQLRQHNFAMYAVGQSFNDYNRLANSNFLLELGYWLEQLPEAPGIEPGRTFKKAWAANAMAVQPMGETVSEGVLYQIQIYAQYKVESEDILI